MTRSSLFGLVALALAVCAAPSTVTAAEGPSSIDLVVVVHQDGQPVEGLTAADFEVRQAGRVATLLAAERVTNRQWMLLFDLASGGTGWVPEARAVALELVSNGLQATDRVGVAILGADAQLRVVQPTLDRSLVAKAIAAVPESDLTASEANADQVASEAREVAAGDENSDESYERRMVYDSQARIEALAESVQGLAGLLHAFGGNNHIVLLSSGVDFSAAMGNDLTAQIDQERALRESEAAVMGDITRTEGQAFAAGGVVEQVVQRAVEAATRHGCAVHGVEFAASRDEGRPWRMRQLDGLWFLAKGSGGEVVRDPVSLSKAFSGLLQRTNVAYRLSFLPVKLRKDGGFHPVKVMLVNSSSVAVAPTGFYAAVGDS